MATLARKFGFDCGAGFAANDNFARAVISRRAYGEYGETNSSQITDAANHPFGYSGHDEAKKVGDFFEKPKGIKYEAKKVVDFFEKPKSIKYEAKKVVDFFEKPKSIKYEAKKVGDFFEKPKSKFAFGKNLCVNDNSCFISKV